MTMKNLLLSGLAALCVVFGIWAWKSEAPVTIIQRQPPVQQPVGAVSGPDHYEYHQFFAGAGLSKYFGIGSVNASTTSSTVVSQVRVLGAGTHGQITLGTSTPDTQTSFNASSTAFTLNSMVFLEPQATTTIPNVTCSANPATTTWISAITASTTNTSVNGFTIKTSAAPITNPFCYNYWILDRSKSN